MNLYTHEERLQASPDPLTPTMSIHKYHETARVHASEYAVYADIRNDENPPVLMWPRNTAPTVHVLSTALSSVFPFTSLIWFFPLDYKDFQTEILYRPFRFVAAS